MIARWRSEGVQLQKLCVGGPGAQVCWYWVGVFKKLSFGKDFQQAPVAGQGEGGPGIRVLAEGTPWVARLQIGFKLRQFVHGHYLGGARSVQQHESAALKRRRLSSLPCL